MWFHLECQIAESHQGQVLNREYCSYVASFQEDMTQKMKQEQHLVKEAQRVQEELENEKRKTEKELEELQNVRRTLSQSEGGKLVETIKDEL